MNCIFKTEIFAERITVNNLFFVFKLFKFWLWIARVYFLLSRALSTLIWIPRVPDIPKKIHSRKIHSLYLRSHFDASRCMININKVVDNYCKINIFIATREDNFEKNIKKNRWRILIFFVLEETISSLKIIPYPSCIMKIMIHMRTCLISHI